MSGAAHDGRVPAASAAAVRELALRQNVVRKVNERIQALAWVEMPSYFCECSRTDCTRTIPLSRADYEAVRASPIRFVLQAGHEHLGVERVVAAQDGHLVVENIGDAAQIARADDPRSTPSA